LDEDEQMIEAMLQVALWRSKQQHAEK